MRVVASASPAQAVFLRWNEFCDEFAPKTREGGQGTRDPSRLSDDLIRRFLVNLPPGFWVNLVKKVQKEGKEDGLSQAPAWLARAHALHWPTLVREHANSGDAGQFSTELALEHRCVELRGASGLTPRRDQPRSQISNSPPFTF